jgi:hypothetical protein
VRAELVKSPSHPPRILIVDDDLGQRSLLEFVFAPPEFLRSSGCISSGRSSGVVKIPRDVHGDEKQHATMVELLCINLMPGFTLPIIAAKA